MTLFNQNKLEVAINYKFSNNLLLIEALTHPSALKEAASNNKNYERLEFLGDAILNFIISEIMFHYFDEKEGMLAKRRAHLVCRETLVKIAFSLKLGDYIIFPKNINIEEEKLNEANLENSLEALIGAIYLDSDISVVKKFILNHWGEYLNDNLSLMDDPKSSVQELVQKQGKSVPEYRLITKEGFSHSPIFEVELHIQGEEPFRARGKSKKRAEKEAARMFLVKYGLESKILK